MTVTRLAAVRARSWGPVDQLGKGSPQLCSTGPGQHCRVPRRPRPLLNVAGGGGSGLAAHAGGVHGLGGNEV